MHQAGEPGSGGDNRQENPAADLPHSPEPERQDADGAGKSGERPRKKRRRRRGGRKNAARREALDGRSSDGRQVDGRAESAAVSPSGAASFQQTGNTPLPSAKDVQARAEEEGAGSEPPVYGALDLGTNNCRLLVAKKGRSGYRVIDAFSRIVRLGEGLAHTGELSQGAMDRALEALKICAEKMERRGVTRARTIATEACRKAANGAAFIERVERETGLKLDVVTPQDEARLAVSGCAPLLDPECGAALVFDIGGGSTELIWVRRSTRGRAVIEDWTSLPCGVVTLAERFGGVDVTPDIYARMVEYVGEELTEFRSREPMPELKERGFHLLGTSGTVTTIAGVQMGLKRYDRNRVDGAWVEPHSVSSVTRQLLDMSFEERAAHACVGRERADLVLAGCAILEAILDAWPADRLRVADRGLREGILFSLMMEDAPKRKRKRRRRRGRRKKVSAGPANAGSKPETGE